VIVPERAVDIDGGTHLGWWLVDPATGSTIDELEDGRGAGLVEYWEVAASILTQALRIVLRRLFACIAIYAAFSVVLLENVSNIPGVPTSVGLAFSAAGIAASSIGSYSALACA